MAAVPAAMSTPAATPARGGRLALNHRARDQQGRAQSGRSRTDRHQIVPRQRRRGG